jgi:NTE family protein
MLRVFQRWESYQTMTQETCAEVGRMALAAQTASEPEWLEWFESQIGTEWPDRNLRLTAVDAETGEFRAWSRDDGVDVRHAVASSCAVPGIFPCVTINGRRYQDGGVRSGTCAWLAEGFQNVLIIAPIGSGSSGIDPLLGRMTNREVGELRDAGANVELVYPDDATLEIFGINRMDNAKRPQAVEAGVAQGREIAGRVQQMWTAHAAAPR